MTHAFHIPADRFGAVFTFGRWKIRIQLRPRTRWWIRQRPHSAPGPRTAPRGGLAVVLRDGPAAYGYAEGLWQWDDLMAYARQVWGTQVTSQMLHHRLHALGYVSDGQHVIPLPQALGKKA